MNVGDRAVDATLDATLRAIAATRGDDVFLIEESGRRTTYTELNDAVTTAALRLVSLGVGVGDTVGVLSTTTRDLIILMYGIHRVGGTAAMINPASIEREVTVVLRKSETVLLIADTETDLAIGTVPEKLAGVPTMTMKRFRSSENEVATELTFPELVLGDPATMIFTSGTTSEPKAVVYHHGHQLHGARTYAANFGYTATDLHMHHFPLFHMNGLNQLGATLWAGARLLLVARFRSSRFDALLDEFRPTLTFLNGTHVKMLRSVDVPLAQQSPLKRVGMSLQMSDDDYNWFETKYGAMFVEGYGLTESVALCLSNPLNGTKKRQCCGIPSESYEIRIANSDGAECAVGDPGELWVRSTDPFGIMFGYVNDPEATAEALADGWLHTGDIVYRDDDGYVFYVEREKDLIKRAGENISASEVRDVIEAFPGVDEAAVVGRPDVLREQLPVAFVTVDDGVELHPREIIEYCRGHLAAYKVPVEVTVVEALPRTAVGKVERRTLEKWAEGTRETGRAT
jgi:crotonobetaine/carnitine-CoA ligase